MYKYMRMSPQCAY